MYIDMFTKAIQ
jgi:hypothetical protein